MALNGNVKTVAWIVGAAVTLVGYTVGTISYVDSRAVAAVATKVDPLEAKVAEEKDAHEKALGEIKSEIRGLVAEQRITREALIRVETKMENGRGQSLK